MSDCTPVLALVCRSSWRQARCRGRERGCWTDAVLDHDRLHYTAPHARSPGMGARLSLRYDREGDTLYIDTCRAYAAQESEELADDIIARLNPKTREVESLEVLFFSARFLRDEPLELPVSADLHTLSK